MVTPNLQTPNQMMPNQAPFNPNWNGPVYGQSTQPSPPIPMGPQNVQMPSLASPQQVPQGPTMLPGKIISQIEDIKANDVPMDGSIAVFIMSDLSSIIARQWNGRGGMDEVRYTREVSASQPVSNDISEAIMQRLDNIEKMIKKNNYRNGYKKTNQKGDLKNV